MATTIPVATGPAPVYFPLRKSTGTAAFHMSRKAVDMGLDDLERLTPKQVIVALAKIMWGSAREMPCPHCGTFDEHYWSATEMRWKCKGCGKRFSVTSKTVFADRKLPLVKILKIALSWSNGASGKPALQLRRDWNVSYPTVFVLLHKLREGLVRGFNTGPLSGIHEMDGMDILGRRHRQKRNVPIGGRSRGKPKIPSHLLASPEGEKDFVGPPDPPKHGKSAQQPADRRLVLVLRQRSVAKGKGASNTRVAIAITESASTVTAMAKRYASAESTIMSDEDPSYAAFSRMFAKHSAVAHSAAYSLADGTNNNQAESFNFRMRRSAEGIYMNPSVRYLHDYGVETGWREDTRGLSNGKRLKHLLRTALWVGESIWWRGFTHGRHRSEELRVDGPSPAPGRGRKPGARLRPPK
jgi:transposase-like protein